MTIQQRTGSRIGFSRAALSLACAALLSVAGVGRAQESAPRQDVPYVPTPQVVVEAMLDLAGVRENDVVYDLGSGDGRIPITAAGRGARGLGVEIVPDLVRQSRENGRAAAVQDRVEFRTQDLFETDLSGASVLTLYLLPDINLRLRERILALRPGMRVVSHDFDMGDWQADRQVTVNGPERTHNLFFWTVPARAAGTWTWTLDTPQGARQYSLQLTQNYQRLSGTLRVGDQTLELLSSELNGDRIGFTFTDTIGGERANFTVQGRLDGNTLSGTANVAGSSLAGQRQITATRAGN